MIYNLGSINIDHFYSLPRLPGPGETLAARDFVTGLGGKGANQSVAAALAGARVCHIGAVGPDGGTMVERLAQFGVETAHIRVAETPTAHAIVMVAPDGENQIVIFGGANLAQDENIIKNVLSGAAPGDWLMLQNETSHQAEAAAVARQVGMNVAYSAAPFDARAVEAVLPFATLLILNAVEAAQLTEALGQQLNELPVPGILITKGADGADWIDTHLQKIVSVPAFPVTPIDTTGAGDTFAGYTVAGLSEGLPPAIAIRRAAAAAAICVTRKGTAEAIPSRGEVEAYLG